MHVVRMVRGIVCQIAYEGLPFVCCTNRKVRIIEGTFRKMATFMQTVLSQINRLGLGYVTTSRCIHTFGGPVCVQASQTLLAAPAKKKKRPPTNINLRQRKKLAKEIRTLERYSRRLKPVEEIEPRITLNRQKELRTRKVEEKTFEEGNREALLVKRWGKYRVDLYAQHSATLTAALGAQQHALAKLREESEDLYQMAIQIDEDLLPFTFKGPDSTPPIEGYDPCDGEYKDITRTFRE